MEKHQNLLLIFTRNPELGKCKTRLASKVGNQAALDIYRFLLGHTAQVTRSVASDKQLYYSETIWENDIWDNSVYDKKLQVGSDLGARMQQAFAQGFADGYERIIIIGSDLYDMDTSTIDTAFLKLVENEVVLGPATDGGYYLLGLSRPQHQIFENKAWGTDSVLADTLADLKHNKVGLLDERNDVDHYEDIADNPAFAPFLKHMTHD
jgi:rSAM/selenodomain-associated transferase 1